MIIGRKIHINGIVQGVGFRPFVYSQAKKYAITGWVKNSSAGVEIVANGHDVAVDTFIESIKIQAPPLSKIDEFDIQVISADNFEDFSIILSEAVEGEFVAISPDVAICDDCLKELYDPHDRRFRYPFINCTNCGPRFTIIKDIPYDRPLTTMAPFKMCARCQAEYDNPLDRRFHAQPVACPDCGPKIWFESKELKGQVFESEDGLRAARKYIREGKIITVKGLGGFHLACDATNIHAVGELRTRKKRSDKPFALMVLDVDTAQKFCKVSESERSLLLSRTRPIVILDRKSGVDLPDAIAPNVKTLGIMLPYTPLHYLLLESENGFPEILVMTSGNMSEEPIAYTNVSAKSELGKLADGFLLNNRDIETRLDDSVVAELDDSIYFYRRSRGYAPQPVMFKQTMSQILAVGAELKNTFCLTKEKYAFLSHHIGDLQNLETFSSFEESIPHYEHLFKVSPVAIACDMHPDYLSTRYAAERSCSQNLELIPIQHHHAHLASVLADNEWESDEPVIGLCFDGTGYGLDGEIWGGEVLLGGYAQFERKLHLAYMPLPGGDAATRHPNKVAAAYLWKNGIGWETDLPAINSIVSEERDILLTQLQKNLNCPKTSSMGRLFDAVAGLIGLRTHVNYEAQAAIELENAIDITVKDAYKFAVYDGQIHFAQLLNDLIQDLRKNEPAGTIAAKFHNAIRILALEICDVLSAETGCKIVALSGGVWQNRFLVRNVNNDLKRNGYQVLNHKLSPANDGGIALGQALAANYMLKG